MEPKERKPQIRLFAHIKDEDRREQLMAAFIGSKVLFDETLRRVLNKYIEESYANVDSTDTYDKPNMVAYIADQAGYRRALKEVLQLLP